MKELSWKLTTLLMLLSGQRIQTIHLLDIRYMTLTESSCSFSISKPVKQTRSGTHVHDLVFQAYFKDPGLCIVECLQEYVIRTKHLRGEETQLLISFVKPHKAVSIDTTARWVKSVLEKCWYRCTPVWSPQHSLSLNFGCKEVWFGHYNHHESCWMVKCVYFYLSFTTSPLNIVQMLILGQAVLFSV